MKPSGFGVIKLVKKHHPEGLCYYKKIVAKKVFYHRYNAKIFATKNIIIRNL